jgi:hypothetical protein
MWEPDDQHAGGVGSDWRGLTRLRVRISTDWRRCCALGCPVARAARSVTAKGKECSSDQIGGDL